MSPWAYALASIFSSENKKMISRVTSSFVILLVKINCDITIYVTPGSLNALCRTRLLIQAYFVIHASLSFLRDSSSSSIYTKNIPTLSSSAGVHSMMYVFLLLYHVSVATAGLISSSGCFACANPITRLVFLAPDYINFFFLYSRL